MKFFKPVVVIIFLVVSCFLVKGSSITDAQLKNEVSDDISIDLEVFDNLTATALKPEVRKRHIRRMKNPVLKELANKLYNKNYQPGLRLADYEAYLNPRILGEQLRIGDGFSKYEGITGVVLEKGLNFVFVDETDGNEISLIVPEWTRKAPEGIKPEEDPDGWGLHSEIHKLNKGINIVNLQKGGLAYIQFFTNDNPENYNPITVHFPNAKVNGYFDITRGDTNSDFNKLLDNAVSPIMDIRGKYIQVAFPVDSLKRFTYNKGVELINNFDTIAALQREFIGWDKEGISPKNRVLARINYHYYMFRDRDGVAYIDWAMRLVAKPESIVKDDPCWGFSHELGHVLQMRPQLTWGGMTEVSNNILTLYSTTMLGNRSRISQENRYQEARETILDKDISYLSFPGENSEGNQYGGGNNTDVFHRLVPFWQLHLYFTKQGYPDFYPDLMIAMRNREPLALANRDKDYLNMLEFCRLASEVSKTDLTEFFERWGFFYTGKIVVNDYAKYSYNILEEDVIAVKKAIADMNLPKPKVDMTLLED